MAKSRKEKDKRYEERHKEERKAKNVIWGTSVPRKTAEEINEFLKARLYEGRTYTSGLRRTVSPTQYRFCKIKGRLRRLFRERTYEICRRKKQKQNIIRKTRYSRLAEI